MTEKLRKAAEQALDALELNCASQTESPATKAMQALRAALAEPTYPLPDDLYPGSKDWAHGTYADRVAWLHTMYESAKRLNAALAEQPAEQEPVGYMNAGHVYELQQKRIPYGYVYPNSGAGSEVALYTAPQPAIPPGYKLVPVEPTEEMEVAGGVAWESSRAHDVIGPLQDAWVAMLAAAPEAPQPAKQPLTDDEIEEINGSLTGRRDLARLFARTIERAHGITGETE